MKQKDISNNTLADRLDKLANDVTEQNFGDFHMCIPARPDHDADLVLSLAAKRLRLLDKHESDK